MEDYVAKRVETFDGKEIVICATKVGLKKIKCWVENDTRFKEQCFKLKIQDYRYLDEIDYQNAMIKYYNHLEDYIIK